MLATTCSVSIVFASIHLLCDKVEFSSSEAPNLAFDMVNLQFLAAAFRAPFLLPLFCQRKAELNANHQMVIEDPLVAQHAERKSDIVPIFFVVLARFKLHGFPINIAALSRLYHNVRHGAMFRAEVSHFNSKI